MIFYVLEKSAIESSEILNIDEKLTNEEKRIILINNTADLDLKNVSKELGLNKINSAAASDTTNYAVITSLLLVAIITTISVFIWYYHNRGREPVVNNENFDFPMNIVHGHYEEITL